MESVSTDALAQVIHQQKQAAGPMRRRGRWFFAGIAVAAGATVFVGFARTYYLKAMFAAATPAAADQRSSRTVRLQGMLPFCDKRSRPFGSWIR